MILPLYFCIGLWDIYYVYLFFQDMEDDLNRIVDFLEDLVEAWYSLEQYIGLKEDKLSSTTVDFIRSEGNLETKCLY